MLQIVKMCYFNKKVNLKKKLFVYWKIKVKFTNLSQNGLLSNGVGWYNGCSMDKFYKG